MESANINLWLDGTQVASLALIVALLHLVYSPCVVQSDDSPLSRGVALFETHSAFDANFDAVDTVVENVVSSVKAMLPFGLWLAVDTAEKHVSSDNSKP